MTICFSDFPILSAETNRNKSTAFGENQTNNFRNCVAFSCFFNEVKFLVQNFGSLCIISGWHFLRVALFQTLELKKVSQLYATQSFSITVASGKIVEFSHPGKTWRGFLDVHQYGWKNLMKKQFSVLLLPALLHKCCV